MKISNGIKPDLCQHVTNTIIGYLESQRHCWEKPWCGVANKAASAGLQIPINCESGRLYSGINILLLWISQLQHEYSQRKWVTFKAAKNLGGSVKRGEKSTQIILYKPLEKEVMDNDGKPKLDSNGLPETKSFAVIKGISLFNIEQCEGLDDYYEDNSKALLNLSDTSHLTGKTIVDIELINARLGVGLNHDWRNKAYYSPAGDFICMPQKAQFKSLTEYYGVLLHECAHATGHKKRLNREGITKPNKKMSASYAFEELIAELASAFVCAHYGIENISNNAAYIKSWCSILRSDKRAIFRASSQAKQAFNYIIESATKDMVVAS